MEFKGTKGKWYSHSKEDLHIKSEAGRTVCFDTSRKNWQHDALLISKAPEMLEMLNRIVYNLENEECPFDEDEIKALIKSATEL